MEASSLSTIAQLLCYQSLPVNFAKLVGDMDKLLDQWVDHPFKASWGSETIVAFDQPGTRVILGWSDIPGLGLGGVLTVSVGPSTLLGKPVMRPDPEALCSRLLAHLCKQVMAEEVIWHRIACHMSAEWVDLLIDALPETAPPPADPDPAEQAATASVLAFPDRLRDLEHADLRAALTNAPPTPPMHLSTPMRLAVHAMNATLIVVWGPLGAVALTYGLIKGENLRRAAHLMVLSGLASAVMNSPSGQQALTLLPIL